MNLKCNTHSSVWQNYDFNHLHLQSCVSEQILSSFPCLVPSGVFLDDMMAASSTSSGYSYCLESHLGKLSLAYQKGFFYQQVFRKIWVLSSPEFQVVLSILILSFWANKTWLVYTLCHTHPIKTVIFLKIVVFG